MRNGFLTSLAGLLVGAAAVLGQEKLPPGEQMPEKGKGPNGKKEDKPERLSRPSERQPFLAGEATLNDPGAGPDLLRGSGASFWTPQGQLWTSAEFLLLWTKKPRTLPTLITGTVIIPPSEEDPGGETIAALGPGKIDYNAFGGFRLSGGYWFDPERSVGMETSLLYLGKRSVETRFVDTPRLFRPFFNFNTREDDSITVASPGIAAGNFSLGSTSRTWGLEANLWKSLMYDPLFKCVRLDLICGLRYLDLAEDVRTERMTSFNADLTATPQFLAFQSNRLFERESIRTHNSFYGAQAGVGAKVFLADCIVLDARTKIAMGVNQEQLNIRGEQLRVRPGGIQTTAPGSLLALPSNIGKHSREQFCFVPEVSANLGIPINNFAGVYVGYTFLYWSRVARPGDQLDTTADAALIPNLPPLIPASTGLRRPGVLFNQTHWWAQGITVGLELNW